MARKVRGKGGEGNEKEREISISGIYSSHPPVLPDPSRYDRVRGEKNVWIVVQKRKLLRRFKVLFKVIPP